MLSVVRAPEFPYVEELLARSHCRRYRAKSTIIRTGEWGDMLYYIVRGSVAVHLEGEDNRDLVLAYLNAGDFFGEMGLFGKQLGDRPRSAFVLAKSESLIAEISYSRFQQLAEQYPPIFYALGSQIAERLRKTTRKAGDLFFLDITGRVAKALTDLCRQPGAVALPEGVQIKVTRQEIGRIVGCSREMAGRVLKSLQEQGHIYTKGRTILVYYPRQEPSNPQDRG